MEKKKRIILLSVIVSILALIFIILLFIRLKPFVLTGPGNDKVGDVYTEANLENIRTPEIDGPMIPRVVNNVGELISREDKETEIKSVEAKDAALVAESILQEEQNITVNGNNFEPKEINVIYNAKVPLVVKALDNNEHEIVIKFDEYDMKLPFSKKSGILRYTFFGPKPGEYEFYIDNPNNKGVLISIEKN